MRAVSPVPRRRGQSKRPKKCKGWRTKSQSCFHSHVWIQCTDYVSSVACETTQKITLRNKKVMHENFPDHFSESSENHYNHWDFPQVSTLWDLTMFVPCDAQKRSHSCRRALHEKQCHCFTLVHARTAHIALYSTQFSCATESCTRSQTKRLQGHRAASALTALRRVKLESCKWRKHHKWTAEF